MRSKARPSAARSTRTKVISYAESSDDGDDFNDFDDPQPEPELLPTRKRRRISNDEPIALPARASRKKSSVSKSTARTRPRPRQPDTRFPIKRKWRSERPPKNDEGVPAQEIPSDGVIPAWATLPYEILVCIFQHAAWPLNYASRTWLLSSATICRAFVEPALTALYRSPPFFSHIDPHQFLSTLKKDQSSTVIAYAVKVRRLEIRADYLSHAATGIGLIDLAELAGACPQLEAVHIVEHSDQPPFRSSVYPSKLLHPDNFLLGFEQRDIRLRSWRWNTNLMVSDRMAANETVRRAHDSPVFEQTEHLELARLAIEAGQVSPKKHKVASDDFIPLPILLRPLRNLKSLSLESCIGEEWDFLTSLPSTICHLRIINNGYLSSSDVEAFLETHGSTLLSLDLSHNQYLDLSFTGRLGSLCPKLRSLKMDATYYSAVALDKDDKPLFDDLLPNGLTPTWPASLQRIELLNLRKWEVSAAETLFGSLQKAAEDLGDLRYLVVRAMLSISWRDRAQFREKYIHGMSRIFKRRSRAPAPELASFRCYRKATGKDVGDNRAAHFSANGAPGEETASEELSEVVTRRSQRLTIKQQQEEQSESESESDFAEGPRQGLCEVVEISIDNLRPAENQFKEQDFLDSEKSGDEDWTEGVEYSYEPTYAW